MVLKLNRKYLWKNNSKMKVWYILLVGKKFQYNIIVNFNIFFGLIIIIQNQQSQILFLDDNVLVMENADQEEYTGQEQFMEVTEEIIADEWGQSACKYLSLITH